MIAEPGARRRLELDRELSASPSVDVVGKAADASTGVALTLRTRPDVAVIGPGFAGADAVDAALQISKIAPGIRILALLAEADGQTGQDVLMAGACGALPIETPTRELPYVLRALTEGEAAVTIRQATALLHRFQIVATPGDGLRPLAGPLSSREWQVLDVLRSGISPENAAARLDIKRATIYSHLRNISRKLGVTNRAEALVAAERLRVREGRRETSPEDDAA